MASNKLEKGMLLDQYGKWLWVMRYMPSHAIHWLSGIFLPPHERYLVNLMFGTYKDNVIVASRGTSKSFTLASMASPYKALLIKGIRVGIFSASGFRGGKLLFDDIDRMFNGELKSQRLPGKFLYNSLKTKFPVRKDPSMWSCNLQSHSDAVTAPTNDADKLRGIRANTIIVDERNTFDGAIVDTVLRPMANVKQDFRRAAGGGEHNQLFQISTIDFQVRDFYRNIVKNRRVAYNEYKATKSRKGGDWKEYHRLHEDNKGELKTASSSYTRFDYSDLLIPRYIEDRDHRTYEVVYPLYEQDVEGVLDFDERDQVEYYYTYPVDKEGLEEPLIAGTMDEEMWLAEQRNVFIRSAGNVFPPDLLTKVGDRPIYDAGEIDKYPDTEFFAPIMYECGDPCVLGVDNARESDEFALVVIRLGQLADGPFDPFMLRKDKEGRPLIGNTSWNNIIWAESWRNWTHDRAAQRIREIMKRYNIIYTQDAGGIGFDKGAGSAVRDELAQPKPPMINGRPDPKWTEPTKVYDPEDKDYAHYAAFDNPNEYWAGLRLLKPQNQDNIDWTMTIRGLMQAKKLYIGYWEPPSRWALDHGFVTSYGTVDYAHPEYQKILVGYNGIQKMRRQLSKLQTKVTETGIIRYVMTAHRTTEEGKKDLYSALIYAGAMAREHLVRLTKKDQDAPMVKPKIVKIGADYRPSKDRLPSRGIFGRRR